MIQISVIQGLDEYHLSHPLTLYSVETQISLSWSLTLY